MSKTNSKPLGCFNATTQSLAFDARGDIIGAVLRGPNPIAWAFGTFPEIVKVVCPMFGVYTREHASIGAERIAAKGWMGDTRIREWTPVAECEHVVNANPRKYEHSKAGQVATA